jgi:mRNA-degrading endonuclease toxin of MazEF toxin-antitoxin module
MRARRGFLYLADLEPCAGTEPGRVRPVLVIQTDLAEVVEKLRRIGEL